CLIGSIDLLYRNSWNEVRTLHFNGEQAMIEALKTILGKMHQDKAQRREKALAMMAKVGLKTEHYDRYPHMFSGGQRQRIAIARG
ncbi:class I adenylate cyclase, partial [Salmonella enterica subsp. enterica serovar Virginia]|nr:class I adenylate cyclase [Salmonella enterica subsp. enterica serovar Virginia]